MESTEGVSKHSEELTGSCGEGQALEAKSIGLSLGQWKCCGAGVVMVAQDESSFCL